MNHILIGLQSLFDRFGYLAVFLTIFLEDFGLPTPGETTLVVGSLLATRGGLNIYAFALLAWAGAVLGDNVGYGIGRYAARSVIVAVARRFFISERRVEAAEGAFRRWGPLLVVVARFIEVLRQLNGIVAGMARMRWRRFFIFNAVGAGLWVAFWATIASLIGGHTKNFWGLMQRLDVLVGVLFALAVASIIVSRILIRARSKEHAVSGSAPDDR